MVDVVTVVHPDLFLGRDNQSDAQGAALGVLDTRLTYMRLFSIMIE